MYRIGWTYCALGMMPYGSQWRLHRRIFQQNFRQKATFKMHPVQEKEIHKFLRNILSAPEKFMDHIKQRVLLNAYTPSNSLNKIICTSTMISISMGVAYGYDVADENDRVVSLANDSVTLLNKYTFTGSAFVNSIPLLRYVPSWFPGATFKKDAERGARSLQRMQEVPIEIVKQAIVWNFKLNLQTRSLWETLGSRVRNSFVGLQTPLPNKRRGQWQ